jgi:hypothetical protein
MRIIVTPQGLEEMESIKQLKEMKGRLNMPYAVKDRQNNSRSISKTREERFSASPENRRDHTKSKKPKFKKSIDLFNKLEMEKTLRSPSDKHDKSTELNIKQKKLQIGKPLADTYIKDQGTSQTNFILPSLNIRKKTETFTISDNCQSFYDPKFSIKDVINEESYKFLKTNYVKQQIMKDRIARIDETKFRSVYFEKKNFEKLEEKLNHKLSPDKLNLLKYLNERKQIGEIFLDKIITSDEERINKINKICQIVFHNEENAELAKGIIKNKLKILKNNEKIQYKSKIESMGKNIENLSIVLKNYDKKIKKIDKYKDLHKDMEKYWRIHNIDKFTKKGKIFSLGSTLNQTSEAGAHTNFNKTSSQNANMMAANQTNSIIKLVNAEPWDLI